MKKENAKLNKERIKHFIKTFITVVIVSLLIIMTVLCMHYKTMYEESIEDSKMLSSIIHKQDTDIAELNQTVENLKIDNELFDKLKHRAELYEEYEYVLVDSMGNRTDMTYEQLEYGIDRMKSNGINPHLLFSIIMVESGGHEDAANPSSSALGYGQLIASTGKSMYKLLGYTGNYNHQQMATNGKLNIEMCSLLISRNMKQYNGDVNKVLCLYTGSNPVNQGYVNKLSKYLAMGGTSLAEIQNQYKGA